ncbi:hypothetical protein F2Q70_00029530 [Brassica cretica]|uniref:Uncharacterized protein n=1 Tax=Brassica cretica TaxID=69181 RepID=A0A8S9FP94_BRACR|nr:hypothetical protein F2Q70_00029530 [Brassica cretica]KAF3595840.1 hypothetical protein DY000_02021335 [Brassica cretica]
MGRNTQPIKLKSASCPQRSDSRRKGKSILMTKDSSMTESPPLQLSSCFAALDIPESSGSLYLY